MKYPFAIITMLGLIGGMMTSAHATNSNVESSLADRGDLSMFYQALLNTGVAGELNEKTEYTVFAPTNAAFTEIQPRAYPCFYSAQCRAEVAAVLRNHIVPRNESIHDLSKWGGRPIPTIGTRSLYVEETYKDDYTVEGRTVLHHAKGEEVSVYPIDGVIASDQELAQFRTQPVASNPVGTMMEKTVTTYRTPVAYSIAPDRYLIPGGYPASPAVTRAPRELPDDEIETTTVTRTTTTQ
jgi:uncharacterized surface protein with fasciclin (FAS1) repeats